MQELDKYKVSGIKSSVHQGKVRCEFQTDDEKVAIDICYRFLPQPYIVPKADKIMLYYCIPGKIFIN